MQYLTAVGVPCHLHVLLLVRGMDSTRLAILHTALVGIVIWYLSRTSTDSRKLMGSKLRDGLLHGKRLSYR